MLKGEAMLLERISHLSQRHVVNTLESRLKVRTSTRTLRAGTREVAQRAQRHARVLRSGRR